MKGRAPAPPIKIKTLFKPRPPPEIGLDHTGHFRSFWIRKMPTRRQCCPNTNFVFEMATHVPVGEDQFQHLELCQSLARMFNRRYGNTFPYPNIVVADSGSAKIKSLRDPTKKMSKSDADTRSCINLTDTPDDILKKIKKAVTDSNSKISYDPEERPGVSNLISIHSLLTKKTVEEICKEAEQLDTLRYKNLVANVIIEELHPIQQKLSELKSDSMYLLNVLENGAFKATTIAESTALEVRHKLGLQFDKDLSSRIDMLQ